MNWPLEYLGKPWIAGAHGPSAFDCWGLLADIYEKQKGIKLSRYSGYEQDKNRNEIAGEILKLIGNEWEILEKPCHLCAVGLSNLPNKIFHVGCFIDNNKGYVIHTSRDSGVMIEPLDKITLNWKYISYYGLR